MFFVRRETFLFVAWNDLPPFILLTNTRTTYIRAHGRHKLADLELVKEGGLDTLCTHHNLSTTNNVHHLSLAFSPRLILKYECTKWYNYHFCLVARVDRCCIYFAFSYVDGVKRATLVVVDVFSVHICCVLCALAVFVALIRCFFCLFALFVFELGVFPSLTLQFFSFP